MSVPKLGTITRSSQEPLPPKAGVGEFGYAETESLDQARALGPFSDCLDPLSDAEIRSALRFRRDVFRTVDSDVVVEEVECWRGYSRADFLCAVGGQLSVIEIKSDRDTLRRFDEQSRVYSSIADRVTLVVGWRLAAQALRIAPWWWDVVLAERAESSQVRFVPLRDGAPNPGVTVAALLAMLPARELSHLAQLCGFPPRLRQYELRQLIAPEISGCEARSAISAWLTKLSEQRGLSS